MLRWLSILQFPLVFLPLCVYGLGVFGSDFDVLAGRLFIGLFVSLIVLDRFMSGLVSKLAGTWAERLLAIVATLLAGVAYRPLHLGYWDEHSVSQALAICALGIVSWGVSRVAAASVGSEARAAGPAIQLGPALVLIGLIWGSAWFYPMLPLLGLAAAFALRAATLSPARVASRAGSAFEVRFGAFEAMATVCIGVDAWLVVWDYQWITEWAPQLTLLFTVSGIAYALPSRARGVALAVGALNFCVAVAQPSWVLNPLHAAAVGLALGALLARILAPDAADGSAPCSVPRTGRRSPLGGLAFFWVLGLVLGLGLYQNLAHAGWRALLLLPAVALALRLRRARMSS